MIKANELRISNILSYYLGEKDCEWASKIIDHHDIYRCAENNEEFNEDHKPIPLTYEWLLRFGFIRVGDWAILHFDPRTGIRFYNFNSAECDIIQDDKFIAFKNGQIKYVHSLQNLTYCLTGEELTIKDTL